MNTAQIIVLLFLLATSALMLWLLIRHLKRERWHREHLPLPMIGRGEAQGDALHEICKRMAKAHEQERVFLAPLLRKRNPRLKSELEASHNQTHNIAAQGSALFQAVVGIALMIALGLLMAACFCDEPRWP